MRKHSLLLDQKPQYPGCINCEYQATVYRNSINCSTDLPLTTWFPAMLKITQGENNLAVPGLQRYHGSSGTSDWRFKHRLCRFFNQTAFTKQPSVKIELAN